jgi:predicted 3-demethylubiquinone-9 3-methyltransferase (glyoxalase superfamily)
MKPKNTIRLWFDKNALDAAGFYAATFPSSEVTAVQSQVLDDDNARSPNDLRTLRRKRSPSDGSSAA